MNLQRVVWFVLALAAWSAPSIGTESDCSAVWAAGWYVCRNNNSVGAVPYDLIVATDTVLSPHHSYPMIWCYAPPRWKFWEERFLQVDFVSGNLDPPTGDTTVWVRFKAEQGYPNKFRPYAAVGEIDKEEFGRYHRTKVRGDLAREMVDRFVGGEHTALHWKWRQSERHRSVGTITLRGPLKKALRSCPRPTGG